MGGPPKLGGCADLLTWKKIENGKRYKVEMLERYFLLFFCDFLVLLLFGWGVPPYGGPPKLGAPKNPCTTKVRKKVRK